MDLLRLRRREGAEEGGGRPRFYRPSQLDALPPRVQRHRRKASGRHQRRYSQSAGPIRSPARVVDVCCESVMPWAQHPPSGMSPWHRHCGEPWPDKDNFAFGQKLHFRRPLSCKAVENFAPRGSQGVFVCRFLLPGVYKGDILIVDLDELATAPPCTKPRVYRVKEVRVPEIGTALPLRVAHLEARERMLADTVDFIDDPDAPEKIAEDDNEDDLEDDEDAAADGSQVLVRILRGSRVYTPRVGPRPVPKVPALNDALAIEFDIDNP